MGEAKWAWKSEEEIYFDEIVDEEVNKRRGILDTQADSCYRKEVERELKKKIFLNSGRIL